MHADAGGAGPEELFGAFPVALLVRDSHELRVWAPLAKSVELVTAERRIACEAEDSGYWRADPDSQALPRRLQDFHRRRRAAAGSALALAARGGARRLARARVRPCRGAGRARRRPAPDAVRFRAKAVARGGDLRAACRHVHPAGHLCRGARADRPPGESRYHARGAHAARDISGPARLGIRRGGSVCAAAGLRHRRRIWRGSSRRATSAVSRCCSMSSTTISGPDGNYLGAMVRISPTA